MDAVVFALYCPEASRLGFIRYFIDLFKADFADCRFFVGINPPLLPEVAGFLDRQRNCLNLSYAVAPDHLVVDSDASAYQAALRLAAASGECFDYYWFGHTKGIVRPQPNVICDMHSNFWTKRKLIQRWLAVHPHWGAFSPSVTFMPEGESSDALDRFCSFPCGGNRAMYPFTFYVIKGRLIREFLARQKRFFDTNLGTASDRFFFERDFPSLVWKLGAEFGHVKTYHDPEHPCSPKAYRAEVAQWRSRHLSGGQRTARRVVDGVDQVLKRLWTKTFLSAEL